MGSIRISAGARAWTRRGSARVWLSAVLAACGSGGSRHGTSPDGAHAPELGSVSAQLVDALCRNQFECPISYDKQLFRAAYCEQRSGGALENCRDYYVAADGKNLYASYEAAAARGTLELDQSRLSALSECRLPIEDDDWFVGKVAVGGACQLHVECDAGYCDTSDSCPGHCIARKPAGSRCEASAECASGACDGTCVESSLLSGVGEDAACDEDARDRKLCGPGLWCQAGTCQRPIAAGAACQSSDDVCETGHVCVPLSAGTGIERQGRCLRLQVQAANEPCDAGGLPTGDTYRVCDVLQIDVCEAGVCVHHAQGQPGEACGRTDAGDTCAAGAACRDGACVALLADGEACSSSGECSGRCNFDTRRCETRTLYCGQLR
jgi:hypothetical protein